MAPELLTQLEELETLRDQELEQLEAQLGARRNNSKLDARYYARYCMPGWQHQQVLVPPPAGARRRAPLRGPEGGAPRALPAQQGRRSAARSQGSGGSPQPTPRCLSSLAS